jgi:hypothetical protein
VNQKSSLDFNIYFLFLCPFRSVQWKYLDFCLLHQLCSLAAAFDFELIGFPYGVSSVVRQTRVPYCISLLVATIHQRSLVHSYAHVRYSAPTAIQAQETVPPIPLDCILNILARSRRIARDLLPSVCYTCMPFTSVAKPQWVFCVCVCVCVCVCLLSGLFSISLFSSIRLPSLIKLSLRNEAFKKRI